MEVQDLIEQLKTFPANSKIELGKVISISKLNDEGYTVRLDFPIIGLAQDEKNGEVILVTEHHESLKHFGEVKKFEE